MFWLWIACAAIGGIGGGFFLGAWMGTLSMRDSILAQARNTANDRNFVLSVLRRELANWMFRRDPDRYGQAYKAAHDATAAIAAADRGEQSRQLSELAAQYPYYINFDLVGVRDYVLYADALAGNRYDEVERHYTDIIRFQALQAALDQDWPSTVATSDKELAHLDGYIRSFKDTLFKARMTEAMREFEACQHHLKHSDGGDMYDTDTLAIRPVAHFAERRYGIHFKDTGEFGLYGVFYPDEFPDKGPYTSFYRSDAKFAEEKVLHSLVLSTPI
jgi:hypothetical protein